jgi:hypothetical protein
MWQLYQYLKEGTANPLLPTFLDNIQHIVHNTPNYRINQSIALLYEFEKDQKISDHLEFLALFMRGLKANDYFAFVKYMRNY